jgi:hypothetical protein
MSRSLGTGVFCIECRLVAFRDTQGGHGGFRVRRVNVFSVGCIMSFYRRHSIIRLCMEQVLLIEEFIVSIAESMFRCVFKEG